MSERRTHQAQGREEVNPLYRVNWQKQPTRNSCGHTAVAMLADVPATEVLKRCGRPHGVWVRDMRRMLYQYGWHSGSYKRFSKQHQWFGASLTEAEILMLKFRSRKNPKKLLKKGHVALYVEGDIYDPYSGINPVYGNRVVMYAHIPVWPELGLPPGLLLKCYGKLAA